MIQPQMAGDRPVFSHVPITELRDVASPRASYDSRVF